MKRERRLPRLSPRVAVIMGSTSDWETMKHSCQILADLGVPHEKRVISAHRTPDLLTSFAASAERRGIRVIIAGAGGAAHLAGVTAAQTLLPVLGVPIQSKALQGLDSLLSIVQMPKGVPVGTLAIGEGGAANAALFAAQMLALSDPALRRRLEAWRREAGRKVREAKL
ncbi:MAG: 5-(carboxyamino)imidazole ribonucleotide mutase [Elusimicrobiota bacterium]